MGASILQMKPEGWSFTSGTHSQPEPMCSHWFPLIFRISELLAHLQTNAWEERWKSAPALQESEASPSEESNSKGMSEPPAGPETGIVVPEGWTSGQNISDELSDLSFQIGGRKRHLDLGGEEHLVLDNDFASDEDRDESDPMELDLDFDDDNLEE